MRDSIYLDNQATTPTDPRVRDAMLPLLEKSFADWSRETLAASRDKARAPLAADWHAALTEFNPSDVADEETAR